MRRRRVGDDDVVALVRQLEVVAAVGHDDPAVRVGQDLRGIGVVVAEHLRHAGHEFDGVRREPVDERPAERRPHPEGDDERVVAGRSGDDRQDRHELGVDGQQRHRRAGDPQLRRRVDLAGLDGRDLVLARLEQASADRRDVRLVRLDEDTRPDGGRDDDDRDEGADRGDPATGRPGARDPGRARCRDSRSTSASPATRTGEPSNGMSTKGTSRLPRMAPTVFVASSPPDSRAGVGGVVREQRRRGREGDAERDRDRQDDQHGRPDQRDERVDRLARMSGRAARRGPARARPAPARPRSPGSPPAAGAGRPASSAGPRRGRRPARCR